MHKYPFAIFQSNNFNKIKLQKDDIFTEENIEEIQNRVARIINYIPSKETVASVLEELNTMHELSKNKINDIAIKKIIRDATFDKKSHQKYLHDINNISFVDYGQNTKKKKYD